MCDINIGLYSKIFLTLLEFKFYRELNGWRWSENGLVSY